MNSSTVVPALQLKDVSKSFGSVLALRDISLHVDPGTVTCVLGDNGAGKSTLIKILSGVHKPSQGQLLVAGQERSFESPRDALGAGIATVFQDLATVPYGNSDGVRVGESSWATSLSPVCGPSSCSTQALPKQLAAKNCSTWASTFATLSSPWARSPVVSVRPWRLPARSTSVPMC